MLQYRQHDTHVSYMLYSNKKKIVIPTEPAELGTMIGAKHIPEYIQTLEMATSDEEFVLVT